MSANDAAVPRFNGADAWKRLTDTERDAIGALALEFVVGALGVMTCVTMGRDAAPYEEAVGVAQDALEDYAAGALAIRLPGYAAGDVHPVPSIAGGVCRECGCTEHNACLPPCSWAEEDLCSACAGAKIEEVINSE